VVVLGLANDISDVGKPVPLRHAEQRRKETRGRKAVRKKGAAQALRLRKGKAPTILSRTDPCNNGNVGLGPGKTPSADKNCRKNLVRWCRFWLCSRARDDSNEILLTSGREFNRN
jgi:hypothetical protein